MNLSRTAAALAAITLLAGAPASVLAETMQPGVPIAIGGVSVQKDTSEYGPGAVNVAFQNTSAKLATDVVFELDVDGKAVDSFDAAGSFAPGVTVDQAFSSGFADNASGTNQNLVVSLVRYADGSTWVNPLASPRG